MTTLFDISLRQLAKLQSLDPMLDENFAEILTVIFYILDDDSKRILLSRNLNPKGIFYNSSTKAFICQEPVGLTKFGEQELFAELSDAKLIRIIKRMQVFLHKFHQKTSIDAYEFAEQLESLLDAFHESAKQFYNNKTRQIERAFLYELSSLLDNVEITIAENRRGINGRIVKLFLKEVFIKHAIQGINFCAWDADDLDGLEINLPAELIFEIKGRKLAVVETQRFWFLIAPTDSLRANRYSLIRFLSEDRAFGLYVTYGCFVPKSKIDDPEILQIILKLISTIYTLDKAIGPSLLKFIEDSKQAHYRHLSPLLRQKIVSAGSLEEVVMERMMVYEKKLSSLVLVRMTMLMQYPMSESDVLIFSHHVQKILADLWRTLMAFSLLPVAEFSDSAHIMLNRLMSYRLLIQKNLSMLCDGTREWKDKLELLKLPYQEITELYQAAESEQAELDDWLEKAEHFEQRQAEGQFLARLGIGRPKYSRDEVMSQKMQVADELFIDIVRLAKQHKEYLVYFEFENPDGHINEDEYRHYAVCYAKNALDKLPVMVRLPENRTNFEMTQIQEIVEMNQHSEL